MVQKRTKEETKNTKQINFEKYKLFEIPFSKVKFENDKSIFIDINNDEGIFLNKKCCYKSKKYDYKQVFLVKIFEELEYELRDNENWEDINARIVGNKLFNKLEDINEEH